MLIGSEHREGFLGLLQQVSPCGKFIKAIELPPKQR